LFLFLRTFPHFIVYRKALFSLYFSYRVSLLRAIHQVETFVHIVLTRVVNFFKGIWNIVWGDAMSVWNKIYGIFSSAWQTYIAGPLGKIRQGIIEWFSNLGNMALQSGKSFINMLVSGITSGAGAIWNAVSGIAKYIWSALGFHSPTESG
jgi:phage-related protein